MKITYRDGTEEEYENIVHIKVDDGIIRFEDKKRNQIVAIATDVIKKIE